MSDLHEWRALPEGWKVKKIEEFADVITGGTPSTSIEEYWKNGTIPWLPSGDLKNCKITEANKFITKLGLDNSAAKMMPKKTVLIALTGATTGQTGLTEIEASTNQSVTGILPSKEHIPEYLFYYLQTLRKKIIDLSYGGAQHHISQGFVKNIDIVLPPLEAQKKIVAILEKAKETRKLRTQADEFTNRLLQSVFLEMFGDPVKNPKGWNEGKLGDFFSDVRYGVSIKSSLDGYPIIGMDSISYEGRIDWNDLSKVELPPDIFKKEKLHKYDLLFNRTNAFDLVGKTGIVDKEIDAVAASYLIRLRIKPSHQPYFVWYLMNSPYFKAIFRQKCKKAVNQANINSKELAAFPAIFPPLPHQQKFAQIVEKVESMRQNQNQSRQNIEDLFNAIMQKAFKGELMV